MVREARVIVTRNEKSIKTRIETHFTVNLHVKLDLGMRNPLKQGLRPSSSSSSGSDRILGMRNPLKQGLRLSHSITSASTRKLGMRNPLKQGFVLRPRLEKQRDRSYSASVPLLFSDYGLFPEKRLHSFCKQYFYLICYNKFSQQGQQTKNSFIV